MHISELYALSLTDPAAARARVEAAFRGAAGNMSKAAKELGLSRPRLYVMIAGDPVLRARLDAVRVELLGEGKPQRGAFIEEAGPRGHTAEARAAQRAASSASARARAKPAAPQPPPAPARSRSKAAATAPELAPKRARRKP
jgi:hypothetical protein